MSTLTSFPSLTQRSFTPLTTFSSQITAAQNSVQKKEVTNSVAKKEIKFSSNFESGSIGTITKIKGKNPKAVAYKLSLRDDNNIPLPESWRTWFYLKAENVPKNKPLQLVIDRLGFPNYFCPVYSYDQKTWFRFSENEVQMPQNCSTSAVSKCELTITKQFAKPTVWIARTFPYTTKDLGNFLAAIMKNPLHKRFVKEEIIGYTPQKRPIRKLTITDNQSLPASGKKKAIFIHARTHPAETGSSFLLEGLIKAILSNIELGRRLLTEFEFHIVPMQNVDGVVNGNYRTNAKSQNLENQWLFNRETTSPSPLNENAPLENQVVAQAMLQVEKNEKTPVVLALNLHSSNSKVKDGHFFYPHFGDNPLKYTEEEQKAWKDQTAFIRLISSYSPGIIQDPPEEGGKGFLNSFYPETRWWHYHKNKVIALTLETVYGNPGGQGWVTPQAYRQLGASVARAIADFPFSQESQEQQSGAVVVKTIPLPVPSLINIGNTPSISSVVASKSLRIRI